MVLGLGWGMGGKLGKEQGTKRETAWRSWLSQEKGEGEHTENKALLKNIKDKWSSKTHGENGTSVSKQTPKEGGEEVKKCNQPDLMWGKGIEVCNLRKNWWNNWNHTNIEIAV